MPVLDRTQPMLRIEGVGDYNGHGYPVKVSCNAQETPVSGVQIMPEGHLAPGVG